MKTAKEIKRDGHLIKTYKKQNGPWFEDTYKFYELDGKVYQIKDHVCVISRGVTSYWDEVTEI